MTHMASPSSTKDLAIRSLLALCFLIAGQACGDGGGNKNTSCSAVRALAVGDCLSPYKFQGDAFVLCNGPYSLCTTADCQAASSTSAQAECACDVVPAGLSIRTMEADQGATRLLSNFSFAQFPLNPKVCPDGPLINCLNSPCTVTPGDPATSTCTCPIAVGAQAILVPPSSDVPCDVLRSGAPVSPNTDALNDALQAAEDCL